MTKKYQQLPQVAFGILLALSLKPRHGYEIIKQVEEDSNGKIKLWPGALYASIKQLHDQKLIEEIDGREKPSETNDSRRRYYRITDKGKKRLHAELAYYQKSL
ncbi:MAG TPA: PadR family transcriptional regulator, partial [Candidatus Paceibacterota bacterium]|nr:PadR family transcriptional regulator [Candidatus Paceibacterota bacterium]